MEVIIDFETIYRGRLFSFWGFILALLFATVATLDLLKLTNLSKYLKLPPEMMLILSIPLFTIPTLGALGNAISEFWGDIFPVFAFFFFITAVIIMGRSNRKAATQNKSLNTGANDAGSD